MTERMQSDFLMYFEQRNLKIPRAARKNIENLDYPKKLNRWREEGN